MDRVNARCIDIIRLLLYNYLYISLREGSDVSIEFPSLEFVFSPESQKNFSPQLFDNDLFLFIDTSVSYPNFSPESFIVIGGRSSRRLERSDSALKLTDIISLPSTDRKLLIAALYKIRESYAIIPLKDKTLVICNRLFRSNGLGLAFVFDFPPECIAAIKASDYKLAINDILFSDSFSSISPNNERSNDFLNSFSYFASKLSYASRYTDPDRNDIEIISEIITAVSSVIGCKTKTLLPLTNISDFRNSVTDTRTMFSFMLCVLSLVRASALDRTAEVSIFGNEFATVKISFDLLPELIGSRINELDFCNKMANGLGFPFYFEINDTKAKLEFIPLRTDPSLSGFKSGIYVNGKLYSSSLPSFLS